MKFLVFGFSVTAMSGGYVERCAAICEKDRPNYEVTKVAIGGLQPDQARHLVEDIVNKHKPDAMILEIATAVYRLRPRTPQQIADHTAGMEALFSLCKERGMHCGILDLPLVGINDDDDWMAETDAEFSKMHNVPFRRVSLNEELLRDNVHPNDVGNDAYAKVLFDLVDEVYHTPPDFSSMEAKRSFGAFAVKDLRIPDGTFREFSRAGFNEKMLVLPEGKSIEIKLPEMVTVTGMIMLMGPTSGTFQLHIGGTADKMHCYDRHCYYEHVGGKPLTPRAANWIIVPPRKEIPPEQLLKGDKNHGPRTGGITHILYEKNTS